MTKSNDNQGAISSLKGMRAQFLYTLYRILSAIKTEDSFKPEGEYEDLEILDSKKRIIEAIQVKNLKEIITLSNILNKKDNCLLKRGLKAHENGNTPLIKLISFSDVNADIKELSSKSYSAKLIVNLKKYGIKDCEIEILKNNFQYEVFKEDMLTENVNQKLIDSRFFANIEITQNILIYWIYISAEKQKIIGKDLLRKQFEDIGSFLTKRTSFADTYRHLLLPLKDDLANENTETIRNEFFQGVSAKYEHILAGLDVLRTGKLKAIESAFKTKNIVFIHGASGQGKSTLSYRFLRDYCDGNTVFEIKLPPDYSSVYRVINALEGISEGLGFPMTLYVDVTPGNKEWVNLLAELSAKMNFRFLVSIREEDWHSVEVDDKFLFSEIELKLNETEANEIYDGLDKFKRDRKFTNFIEAWEHFGENGPLLEFVYLITQTQSLEARIKSQIKRLLKDSNSKEKIQLLKYVSLADSFGARLKYKEYFQKLEISNSLQLIHELKEEYLIQTIDEGTFIVGLHPVRSKLIKKELFDPILEEEAEYALQAIVFISDNTLLDFLRNSFAHANLNVHRLLHQLQGFNATSWQAYFQILKSLLWKGLSDYIKKNKGVLDQIHQKLGIGWTTTVNFDFANVFESGNMVEGSDFFPEEAKMYAKEMNSKFSSKEEVFKYCQLWLDQISTIKVYPENKFDWDSFGLFLFWLHHFQIDSVGIDFTKFDFDKLFKEYPLIGLGQIIYSLKLYNEETQKYEEQVDQIFWDRFYNEFKIFYLEEKENQIDCKYIVDIQDKNFEDGEKDIFHARSLKIIELLRLVLPLCDSYRVKASGNKFSFIPDNFDTSEMNVSKQGLPLKPLVELNSTYINLFSNYYRPHDWFEYVDKVIEQRRYLALILVQLAQSFKLYHVKQDWRKLNDYIQDYFNEKQTTIEKSSVVPFPKMIVDEWGEFGDSEIKNKDDVDIRPAISAQRYKQYREEYNEYHRTITNFLKQSAQVINFKLLQIIDENVDDYSHTARISLVGNLFELFKHIEPFQNQFRFHFEKFVEPILLKQLDNQEKDAIVSLCFLWRQYLYVNKFITEKKDIKKLAIEKIVETKSSFQNRLVTSFKKLAKQIGVKIRVEFEEEKKRCIILLDVDNPFLGMEMLQLVYQKMHLNIIFPDYTSLKYLQLSANYQSFFLITFIKGRTYNNMWHEFGLFNLHEKNFEELGQNYFMPSEIDPEIIRKFEIVSWNETSEEIQNLQKMIDAITEAYQIGYHLIQFSELESDSSEDGNNILAAHKIGVLAKLLESIIKCNEHFLGFNNKLCDEDYMAFELEDKSELLEIFQDSFSLFYPDDDFFNNNSYPDSWSSKNIEDWLPRLEKLSENLTKIYLVFSYYIINGFVV